MRRLLRHAVASAALAAAVSAAARLPDAPAPREVPRATPPPAAAGAEGGYETGRLTAGQAVAGPFVLTFLSAGAVLEVVSIAPGGGLLGRVAGPLAAPFHLAAGTVARLPAPGEALYAGYRPSPLTRALDAWIGRAILIGLAAAQPEPWTLRSIGGDHLVVERSRTYRVLPLRRIAEITWTDLTGIDPTPRVVLAPP